MLHYTFGLPSVYAALVSSKLAAVVESKKGTGNARDIVEGRKEGRTHLKQMADRG
jgi:hypothetical protein